jgi:hypothetical protein
VCSFDGFKRTTLVRRARQGDYAGESWRSR